MNQQEAAEAEELVSMLKSRHEEKKESSLSTHRAREFDSMVRASLTIGFCLLTSFAVGGGLSWHSCATPPF